MTPGTAFATWLATDAIIMALVKGISPIDVPQRSDTPWVCYRWISGSVPVTHDGPSNLNLGARLEVTVWSEDADLAAWISVLIRRKLGPFRGTMGSGGVLMACWGMVGPRQLRHPETGYMGVQSDFLMNVDESTISDPYPAPADPE